MTTKRVSIEVPGDNTYTVLDLRTILEKCPYDAAIRTVTQPDSDPVILIWWDEDL